MVCATSGGPVVLPTAAKVAATTAWMSAVWSLGRGASGAATTRGRVTVRVTVAVVDVAAGAVTVAAAAAASPGSSWHCGAQRCSHL